jgi:hypothetical protein
MLFSRRAGLRPAQKALQVDTVDSELKNALWSVFHELVLKSFTPESHHWPRQGNELPRSNLEGLFFSYWFELYEWPTDSIPMTIDPAIETVRKGFFAGDYGHVYDFLEVTLAHVKDPEKMQSVWNTILEKHNSAYRMVDRTAVRITSDTEIAAIESALDTKLRGVRIHLHSALEKLADRKTPDYRNSVKESISSVESLTQSVTGQSNATLGDALKVLGPAVGMHGAFREALSKLYGFTSDADGIRHAILDEPNVTYTDALFMLVVCSAFVNYVIGKAAEGKLTLRGT